MKSKRYLFWIFLAKYRKILRNNSFQCLESLLNTKIILSHLSLETYINKASFELVYTIYTA